MAQTTIESSCPACSLLQFELYNTSLTLHRSEACTQEVLADQIQLFKLLTGDPSSVELSDLTVVIHNFTASSVPVFNATTNLPSARRACWSRLLHSQLLLQALVVFHAAASAGSAVQTQPAAA